MQVHPSRMPNVPQQQPHHPDTDRSAPPPTHSRPRAHDYHHDDPSHQPPPHLTAGREQRRPSPDYNSYSRNHPRDRLTPERQLASSGYAPRGGGPYGADQGGYGAGYGRGHGGGYGGPQHGGGRGGGPPPRRGGPAGGDDFFEACVHSPPAKRPPTRRLLTPWILPLCSHATGPQSPQRTRQLDHHHLAPLASHSRAVCSSLPSLCWRIST